MEGVGGFLKDAELKGQAPLCPQFPQMSLQGCPQTRSPSVPHALCSPPMAGLGPVVGLKQGLGELTHLDLVIGPDRAWKCGDVACT